MTRLPIGKLPATLLEAILDRAPVSDSRVLMGPGIGLDCAVIDHGESLLILKSDPITFVADDIGHYLVQINTNDIATTGAVPRWLMVTLLLPQDGATDELADRIMDQIFAASRQLDISVVGGHTEITHGLDRPIAVGALVGEVARDGLITPRGAQPGDRILLTKGIPIETTAILAREFPQRLATVCNEAELAAAREFVRDPGIGVLTDARLAVDAGRVTAMHDPTEGGLVTALWELAQASGRRLRVRPDAVPIPELSARACAAFGLDPYASIASGALLLTVPANDAETVSQAVTYGGIACAMIGTVEDGPPEVVQETAQGPEPWPRPERDALAAVYEG